jgi:transcriptional regulator with XRE-family HTH domain
MEDRTMNDGIGTACRDLRHALGMTQSELADQLGCSRQDISDVECGRPTSRATRLKLRIMKMAEEMEQRRADVPGAMEQDRLDQAFSSAVEVAESIHTQLRSLQSLSKNASLTSQVDDESRFSAEAERRTHEYFEKLAWRVGAKLVCEITGYPFHETHAFGHDGPWQVVSAYFDAKGVKFPEPILELPPGTFATWPLHLVVREGHRRALLALSMGLAAADGCQDCVEHWLGSIDAARAMFLTRNDSVGR